MEYQIVEMGGKFAAKILGITRNEFVNHQGDTAWTTPSLVIKNCLFDTIEAATEAADAYIYAPNLIASAKPVEKLH